MASVLPLALFNPTDGVLADFFRSDLVRRARSRLYRWQRSRAGLDPDGENVSPEAANDLYVAHLSIYRFFAQFAPGMHVIDLGCGVGYGCAELKRAGAASVLGVDLDQRNIRYASKRFSGQDVSFSAGDIQALPSELGVFEIAVSSNAFEHLDDVEAGLEAMQAHLASDGTFLMAVPPIVNQEGSDTHARIHFHRSNLMTRDWHARLSEKFRHVDVFRHVAPKGLDLSSPFRSKFVSADFQFLPATIEDFSLPGTLTAIFHCK